MAAPLPPLFFLLPFFRAIPGRACCPLSFGRKTPNRATAFPFPFSPLGRIYLRIMDTAVFPLCDAALLVGMERFLFFSFLLSAPGCRDAGAVLLFSLLAAIEPSLFSLSKLLQRRAVRAPLFFPSLPIRESALRTIPFFSLRECGNGLILLPLPSSLFSSHLIVHRVTEKVLHFFFPFLCHMCMTPSFAAFFLLFSWPPPRCVAARLMRFFLY